MACQIKVRDKRDKSLSRVPARPDPLLDRVWPVTIRPEAGGVVFSKLSKLLNQESALSAPCL
jgi:hypothetical protein